LILFKLNRLNSIYRDFIWVIGDFLISDHFISSADDSGWAACDFDWFSCDFDWVACDFDWVADEHISDDIDFN
jgi:hypothetical protein